MFSNRRDIPLPIDLGSVPDCFIVVDTTPSEPRRSRLLFRQ